MPTLAELQARLGGTKPVSAFQERIALIRGAGPAQPQRRDLLTLDDLLARFDAAKPGPVEWFINAIGEGLIDVGKDILDFPARTFRGMQALGEGIAVGVGLGKEKLGLIPEGAGFQPTISPEEAEKRLTASAFDAVFQLGGFGLGRFGKSIILKGLPKATSRAATAFNFSVTGAVEGVTAGLSPFFVDRNDPVSISSRLATAAEFGVFGAVTRPAIAGLSKVFTPDAAKFRKSIQLGLNKLNTGQFLRNIVPQVRRRLLKTADTFNAAADDIMVRVDTRIVAREAELGLKGQRLSGAARNSFQKKAIGEEMELVGPELQQVLLEELSYVAAVDRRVISLLAGPLKGKARQKGREELSRRFKKPISQVKLGVEGFNIDTFRKLLANNNRLRDALRDGQLRFDSFNHIRGVANELNAFAKESVLALRNSTSPSPLQTLKEAMALPITSKNFKPAILTFRNNLFGYLSLAQDSIGNVLHAGTDLAARGMADSIDVLLGSVKNATRISAVINSVRNKKLVQAFAKANTRGIFVAGEAVGRDPALSVPEKVLDIILFGGLKGKGVVDSFFRRYAARVKLFDEAYAASQKAGVSGVERELFVRNFLADLPAGAQARTVDFANRAAFIVPRSARFTAIADHPAAQLFISPFIRFGAAWAEFMAEFVPVLGTVQTVRRGVQSGLMPLDIITQAATRQLTGAGMILAVDKLLYDNLDFSGFGVKYTDPDSGRQTILPSPFTDIVFLTALAKGDFEKASAALEVSGLTFLGGGLLGPLPLQILQPGKAVNMKTIARDTDRVFQNLFPGRAMFAIMNDMMTDHREEPFTEEGTFIPGLTLFPGITGRARLRPGGEESSLKKLMFTDLNVPRSFGSIVTVKDLNATERFLDFMRVRTGRTPNLTAFSDSIELRTRDGIGVVVPSDTLDDRVKRFYIRKRGEYFALSVAGLDNNPFFRAQQPKQLEQWLDYYLNLAGKSAKRKTERTFSRTLNAVGELP